MMYEKVEVLYQLLYSTCFIVITDSCFDNPLCFITSTVVAIH